MQEIVGARIGTVITNNRGVIAEALKNRRITAWLDRARMKFMADLDLGRNWENMANGPTLFLFDDNGNPHNPNQSPNR